MNVVSNAGPFIILTKLNVLGLLRRLYGRVLFSGSVYDEVVVQGKRCGYSDAFRLDMFLREVG